MTVTSPDEVWRELRRVIEAEINSHERSMQKRIGPSELGTPCTRKLGFKLAQIDPPPGFKRSTPWRPTVGTAVHEWLGRTFEKVVNATSDYDQYEIEHRTTVGTILGEPIDGTADLVVVWGNTVVDWKVPGPTTMRECARRQKRGELVPEVGYRAQAHGYARGLIHEGYDIEHVMIVFLPAAGELNDAIVWSEPYDAEYADSVIHRARRIAQRIEDNGPQEIGKLKRVSDHCNHCPWFIPGAEPTSHTECPGSNDMVASRSQTPPSVESLLG